MRPGERQKSKLKQTKMPRLMLKCEARWQSMAKDVFFGRSVRSLIDM